MSGPQGFETGAAPTLRGEREGEGPAVVLCHGLTATRVAVLHGSRALVRAGWSTTAYDARGHGESDPAPAGGGYGYPELIDDLAALIADRFPGGERVVVAGHSMGAHTAAGLALRDRSRIAGLVLVGPTFTDGEGEASLARWDALADALESGGIEAFVATVGAEQRPGSPWLDSVLRFTRERMERHRDLGAVAAALRQVPRSRPFRALDDLGGLDVPCLVVGSGDLADPGHPRATAEAYAETLPDARFAIEEEGRSPLAWQGGRLAREIARFCEEIGHRGGG